jgi:hypothetical protein
MDAIGQEAQRPTNETIEELYEHESQIESVCRKLGYYLLKLWGDLHREISNPPRVPLQENTVDDGPRRASFEEETGHP